MPQQQQQQSNTIVITNFGGRLTRKLNGDLNSGFAKFANSFGYDPFSKPDNLTWFEQPTSVQGTSTNSITGLIMGGLVKPEGSPTTTFVYAVDTNAILYKITSNTVGNPLLDQASIIGSIAATGTPSFNFGAAMQVFGNSSMLYISADDRINQINTDGSGGKTVQVSVLANRFHAMTPFVGKMAIGNGNNIQTVDSTGLSATSLISSGTDGYGVISPPLPVGNYITDMDVSVDGNYLLLTASNILPENIATPPGDRTAASGGSGTLFKWNGVDVGITSENFISSYQLSALQTYLGNQILFANDSMGASLNDGTNKLLTLPNNKAPFSNATAINGNFISWIAPEVVGSSIMGSMYYYGQLDQENQPGLWRVLRQPASIAGGYVYQTPVNLVVNNAYSGINNAVNSVATFGYGKHYFSLFEVSAGSSSVASNNTHLYKFLVTSTGTGTPQLGVYETQTQLFSKKVSIKQLRVYTEPTVANQGFQIDLIGSDGNVLTNGTLNYTFAAGSDPTKMQGSLDRVDFNPAMSGTYALGVRITNTGTVNMTIKKVEIDPVPGGK